MTREEASKILDDYDVNFDGHTAEEIAKAFDVAFRALEQEPCEDAVSRKAVLEVLKDKWGMFSDANDAMQESIDTIESLSTVTPQEPCEDAISRTELLKAIDTWDKFGYTETGCFVREPKNDYVPYVHYEDMVNCVKGMPPHIESDNCGNYVVQELRWIPVSERMPEEREWIGTKKFGTTISDEVYVTLETISGKRFCDHIRFQNGKFSLSKQAELNAISKGTKPIAWMPLPKPYEPQESEGL